MIAASLCRVEGTRARLLGSRCDRCGDHAFPARVHCASCGTAAHAETALSGAGTVRGYTEVCLPPHGFREPYLLATVDLDEGPRVIGMLVERPPADNRVMAIPHAVRDGELGFAFAVAR
jgi:uncharacterized OB-fold protein